MEVQDPVSVQEITLADGKHRQAIRLRTRAECRELIAAVARASAFLPVDGEGVLELASRPRAQQQPELAAPGDEAFAEHLAHSRPTQIDDMAGSEVRREYLAGRSRDDLEQLLVWISGYCPAAFADALEAHPPREAGEPGGRACAFHGGGKGATGAYASPAGCPECNAEAAAMLNAERENPAIEPFAPPHGEHAVTVPCGSASADWKPCARLDGHPMPHRDAKGNEWAEFAPAPGTLAAVRAAQGCRSRHPRTGVLCELLTVHEGPHRSPGLEPGDPDITWADEPAPDDDTATGPQCPDGRLTEDSGTIAHCIRHDPHDVHRDASGFEWTSADAVHVPNVHPRVAADAANSLQENDADATAGFSLVGSLVEDACDDSPVPVVGLVVGQPDEEHVDVVWGQPQPGEDPGPAMTEPIDALRPAREQGSRL